MLTRRCLIAGILAAPVLSARPGRSAPAASPLRLGYFDFPPFTLTEADGSPAGILVDQLRQVLGKSGDAFSSEKLPPARVVAGMVNGSIDLCLLPNAYPQWRGKVLSTAKAINRVTVEAVSLTAKLAQEGDLSGRSLVVQQGYGYGGVLDRLKQSGIRVVAEVKGPDAGLQVLAAGRADVLLHYRNEIEQALHAQATPGPLSRLVLSDAPVYINLSEAAPDAAAVMARFDAAIAALPGLIPVAT